MIDRTCPDCGRSSLHFYIHVAHCEKCGWHRDTRKIPRHDLHRERRAQWTHFTINDQHKYNLVQIESMAAHMVATPALDRIDLAPHTAFGEYEGNLRKLKRNA